MAFAVKNMKRKAPRHQPTLYTERHLSGNRTTCFETKKRREYPREDANEQNEMRKDRVADRQST